LGRIGGEAIEPCYSVIASATRGDTRTIDMPSPFLTPRLRNIHQIPAPAIPAAPVPLDQAPRAVRDDDTVGKVVVSCRKVSSPKPDESEAKEIPSSRG